jgi:arginyl-tRNA synthetase
LQNGYNSHVLIDLDVAVKKSEENHLYYVQYAYARINQIFTNLETKKIDNSISINQKFNLNEFESELINTLLQAENIIKQVEASYEVHRLTNYMYELAQKFHRFYNEVNVVNSLDQELHMRIAILNGTKSILNIFASLLAIQLPEKM